MSRYKMSERTAEVTVNLDDPKAPRFTTDYEGRPVLIDEQKKLPRTTR